MIELTSSSYETVGSQDENGVDHSGESREVEEIPPREETVEAANTLEQQRTEIFSGYAEYPQYRVRDATSSDRLFVNLVLLCFLLSLSFAFGDVHEWIPFMSASRVSAPARPASPPTSVHHSFEPTAGLYYFHSQQPTPTPAPRGPPPAIQICRPPTIHTSNSTAEDYLLERQVYHKRAQYLSEGSIVGIFLSGDASIMVWLDPWYPACRKGSKSSKHCYRGQLRTFGWDCESNSYKPIGYDLDGEEDYQQFGVDAKLSDDGKLLIVKSHEGRISVFEWKDHQWRPLFDNIASHSLCFITMHRAPRLPTFAMNKNGTTFAVMKEYIDEGIIVVVYRLINKVWEHIDYKLSIPDQECKGDIGIAISEDEIMTVYGLVFGIVRTRLVDEDSTIVPIGQSALHIFDLPPGQEIASKQTPFFYASVSGKKILYTIFDGTWSFPQSKRVGTVSLIEYRDGEWVKLYNDTHIGAENVAKHVTLAYDVALLYDPWSANAFSLMVTDKSAWQSMTYKQESHFDGGILQISGDGSFVVSAEENGFVTLYSVNNMAESTHGW